MSHPRNHGLGNPYLYNLLLHASRKQMLPTFAMGKTVSSLHWTANKPSLYSRERHCVYLPKLFVIRTFLKIWWMKTLLILLLIRHVEAQDTHGELSQPFVQEGHGTLLTAKNTLTTLTCESVLTVP